MGKGRTEGNTATVAGARAAGRPEHGRAGDAVAGGGGKGATAGEAAQAVTASGARTGRREGAAAAEVEAMAVG